MRKSLRAFCLEAGEETLLWQWDTEKNIPLTPDSILSGSGCKDIWWRCDQGHRWQASVYARTRHSSGCPYCLGKKVLPGENDLATRYPDLASEWDREKNGTLSPADVMPGTHRKVWWRCAAGHEWLATVKSRTEGAGCPVCAHRSVVQGENDLQTTHPALAAQWHPEKNGALTPRMVVSGSARKVWWRCDKGHVWQASITTRAGNNAGCPVCAGKTVIPGENDLQSNNPTVAAQWHPEKNKPLEPTQVTPRSNRKVWWVCSYGHAWRASVSSRVEDNKGCPYCSNSKALPGFNDLASLYPVLALQWHPVKNGSLTPDQVTAGSAKRVWWQCESGHEWVAKIYSRTGPKGTGCPGCSNHYTYRTRRKNVYTMTNGKVAVNAAK